MKQWFKKKSQNNLSKSGMKQSNLYQSSLSSPTQYEVDPFLTFPQQHNDAPSRSSVFQPKGILS